MKHIALIALGRDTSFCCREQLYKLLDNRINISNYYVEGNLPQRIKADFAIFTSRLAYQKAHTHLSQGVPYLISRRSINYHEVDKLFELFDFYESEAKRLIELDQLSPQELFSRAWQENYGSEADEQTLKDFAVLLQEVQQEALKRGSNLGHDHIRKNSYYRTFTWAPHVHMICSQEMSCVELDRIQTAVYGCSYHSREILEPLYDHAVPEGRQKYEILLAHGGDEKHIPIKSSQIMTLGYDYAAFGHIHKPQMLVENRMAYAGSLEPTDVGDTGAHGYIEGKITGFSFNRAFR